MKDRDTKSLLVIVCGFMVLHYVFKVDYFKHTALIIALSSLIFPITGTWVLYVWSKIGEILGWINSRILLSVVFYVFLYPIALLFKLMNKDNLALKPGNRETLYSTRDHKFTKKDIENIW